MKKISLLVITLVAVMMLASCSEADGYFYNIEDARSENSIYAESENFITVISDGKTVDFIFNEKEGLLFVTKFVSKDNGGRMQYKISSYHSYKMSEIVDALDSDGDYYWGKTSSTPYQVEFYVTVGDDEYFRNQYKYFRFDHENTEYTVYYNVYED